MLHKETVRILPNAKTAVLFIHGICGTPNHFRYLLPLEELVPDDWSVYNMVLDGHCKGVKDFAQSSMEQWQTHAQRVFSQLCDTHERVVLVGHSMGTLFSIRMAQERPEKVPLMFLIAVPLRFWPRLFGIRNILRLAFERLDKSDPLQAAMEVVCGIQTTKKIWKYIPWLPRMVELLREMSRTAKVLSQITVPAIAYQSEKDELVANKSRKLLEKCGRVEVHNLLKSTHFYYHPQDVEVVRQAFTAALQKYVE